MTTTTTTTTMQFREGAEVLAADGEHLGDVERMVVNPAASVVSHVVASKGLFFETERVIPIDVVERANSHTVRLKPGVDPDELPEFEETHYVISDEDTGRRVEPDGGWIPLIFGFPMIAPVGSPQYPMYPATEEVTTRNVPAGTQIIDVGSSVVTSDGQEVGEVTEVDLDEAGRLVGVRVDPGWFRSEQLLPAHIVRGIDQNRVTLAVSAATLEHFDRSQAPR
ncbi:MAG: PRC-barrel domain-containing protein [Acidimicrobiales bacterium]